MNPKPNPVYYRIEIRSDGEWTPHPTHRKKSLAWCRTFGPQIKGGWKIVREDPAYRLVDYVPSSQTKYYPEHLYDTVEERRDAVTRADEAVMSIGDVLKPMNRMLHKMEQIDELRKESRTAGPF